MKFKTIKNSIKLTALSFLMIFGAQNVSAAIGGTWTEWHTIDTLNYVLWSSPETTSNGAIMRVIPEVGHTIINPANCSNTDSYEMHPQYATQHTGSTPLANLIVENQKLLTLAFTAGYQVSIYVRTDSCSATNNRPMIWGVQIKK